MAVTGGWAITSAKAFRSAHPSRVRIWRTLARDGVKSRISNGYFRPASSAGRGSRNVSGKRETYSRGPVHRRATSDLPSGGPTSPPGAGEHPGEQGDPGDGEQDGHGEGERAGD